MKDKTKLITILAISAVIIITGFTVMFFTQRVRMNDGYVTGNTAGNLNNKGLFCESDGVVYFSNAYDNGCLYSMNPDGTNMEKLTSSGVTSINADSHYLYYFLDSGQTGDKFVQRNYGIYRSKLNGKNPKCLKRGNAIALQLCGNYLYYQNFDNYNENGTELFKIKIDKSEDTRIADFMVNPACIVDGMMYFNGTKKDHYLYALNAANDSISVVWEGNIWNPIYYNGYFYYMDVGNNYRLCRYLPSQNAVEVLTNDRVDTYNIYGDYIYYQKNSQTEPALMRMYIDGSGVEMVAAGNYSNINIVSNYVYFNAFDSTVPMYRTPLYGSIQVSTFDAAEEAAIREINKK